MSELIQIPLGYDEASDKEKYIIVRRADIKSIRRSAYEEQVLIIEGMEPILVNRDIDLSSILFPMTIKRAVKP